jgi:uncharacterized protein YcbX
LVADPPAIVAALRRYPVKSMLGEELDECAIGPAGVLGDRAYSVIDETDGKIASAKNPRKWGALLEFHAGFLSQPVAGQPAPPALITGPDGSKVRTDDPDVHAVLSKALGRAVRLASAPPTDGSFEEAWPDLEGLAPQDFIERTTVGREQDGQAVSAIPLALLAPPGTFFDLSVLHLLTTATLRRLSELGPGADFDARRYRPNVLVATDAHGFVENSWVGHTIRIGEQVEATVTLPTMRCVMTTLAQRGLGADRETLRVIAAHNRVAIEGFGTWACAGVYADVTAPGDVHVGDRINPST